MAARRLSGYHPAHVATVRDDTFTRSHGDAMTALRAILFDHDGTLVDSEPIHHAMWQGVLADYGVHLDDETYKRWYAGISTVNNAIDLVARFAIAEAHETLARQKAQVTDAFLSHSAFPLMPGVLEALARFRAAGLRFGIVTGAGPTGVRATLREHALNGVFETVVCGDEVPHSKPAPDAYLLALARLNLSAGECVAIEDTEHGVNAAAAAGIACVAVPNAMSARHDFSRASAVCGNLAEAVAWVGERYGNGSGLNRVRPVPDPGSVR